MDASRRVAHDKSSWRNAVAAASRVAQLESDKLTKRAEAAEAECTKLRSQVTSVKSQLEAEKQRASKQATLATAALLAANKARHPPPPRFAAPAAYNTWARVH